MQRLILLYSLVVLPAALVPVEAALTQPVQGDLVLAKSSSPSGVFYVTWPSGTVKTIWGAVPLDGLQTDCSNGAVLATSHQSGFLYRYPAGGGQYKVCALSTLVTGMTIEQDRSYLASTGAEQKILRVDSNSSVSTWMTIPTLLGLPNAVCRDGNTGDLIVGTVTGVGAGNLLRVLRTPRKISVLSTVMGAVYAVDWIPQTGEYVVAAMKKLTSSVSWVRSTGTVRTRSTIPKYASAVTVNQKTGQVFVAGSSGSTGIVYEYSHTGAFVRSRNLVTGSINDLEIWDDQNVSVDMASLRREVTVLLGFLRSAQKPYCVALSMAPNPGLQFGPHNWLNLQLDTLFLLTVCGRLNYFTTGFIGTLTPTGRGKATFLMPQHLSHVYVSAVAVNPAFPNNLDVGNVEVVQMW